MKNMIAVLLEKEYVLKSHKKISLFPQIFNAFIWLQMRFVMYDGEFRKPDQYTLPTIPEGNNRRYKISDVYLLQIDPDIVMYAGLLPGWKVIYIFNSIDILLI